MYPYHIYIYIVCLTLHVCTPTYLHVYKSRFAEPVLRHQESSELRTRSIQSSCGSTREKESATGKKRKKKKNKGRLLNQIQTKLSGRGGC